MMDAAINDEVFAYFHARGNRFRNSKGMEFGLTGIKTIWTHYNLSNHDHGPLAVDIITEEDHITEFIEGFKLTSADDIDNLEYTNSWMRYLNGKAEIQITPFDLEASVSFKIVKWKTIIFSLDLHFYDEVYEHLTMPEDFKGYFASHENRLNSAGDNRYRLNRK